MAHESKAAQILRSVTSRYEPAWTPEHGWSDKTYGEHLADGQEVWCDFAETEARTAAGHCQFCGSTDHTPLEDETNMAQRACVDCGRQEDAPFHPTDPNGCPACDGQLTRKEETNMAQFRLLMDVGGVTFDVDRDSEIARILRDAADHIEQGAWERVVRDANGNTIGDYGINTEGRA